MVTTTDQPAQQQQQQTPARTKHRSTKHRSLFERNYHYALVKGIVISIDSWWERECSVGLAFIFEDWSQTSEWCVLEKRIGGFGLLTTLSF